MTGEARPLAKLSAIKLAFLARQLREAEARQDPLHVEPIAIIGMGCRFPGGANDPNQYWRMLAAGVDAIGEVPSDRWDWQSLLDADPAAPGKMTSRWGGFLDSVDGFDAGFFGISPREALQIDPQQRVFLEVAYEALDDAGLVRERLAGTKVGVFAASYHNDYAQLMYGDRGLIGAHTVTGASHSILANRLSYLLDLRGPSISIDTACSSSLVALHLACRSLRQGESDVGIAGGVSLILTPELSIALSKWGFLAEDGRCKTFDARANGFVRGEGCGVVALKRLSDALVDNDRILALIRGTAVNQDGRTNVLTAPSGLAQQAVVREALSDGALTPDDVSYIEAHGTGTSLGDPIELEALAAVIGTRTPARRVVIGSVKTNIGHLEAAAGIAGVIKVVMAMREGAIPAHLHYSTPNPHFDLARSPFRIPTAIEAWPAASEPRRAGVSSFGFGGTNAHVVLEEAPVLPSTPSAGVVLPFLLPISAQTPEALATLAERYAELLTGSNAPAAVDVCFSAGSCRDHADHRLTVLGNTAEELSAGLTAGARGASVPAVTTGSRAPGDRASVVFVFAGQGPQWCGMGLDLLRTEAVFADAITACDAAMRPHVPWRLLDELTAPEDRSRLDQTEIAQPALFAMQVGLTALWRAWGVEPAAVIGHSVGEIAAAFSAGVLDLDTAAQLAVGRGRIMQAATGRGRMATLEIDASEGERVAEETDGLLAVAATNGPRSTVLSGDPDALERTVAALAARGIGHKMLPVNYAFHSAQMEPLREELERTLAALKPGRSDVPIYSTVTGTLLDGRAMGAAYWGRNLRETVRFAPAIEAAAADEFRIFLEISPNPALRWDIEELLTQFGGGRVATSLRRGRSARNTLLASAGELYVSGAAIRWDRVQPNGRRVDLPSYPWQRRRFWVSPTAPAGSRESADPGIHPLLGRKLDSPALSATVYESVVNASAPSFLHDHVIGGTTILPAAAILEMALASAGDGRDIEPVRVEDLVLVSPISLADGSTRLQTVVDCAGPGEFALFSRLDGRAGGDWVRRATGRIGTARPIAADGGNALGAARGRCVEILDGTVLYATLETMGLEFGPSFRRIDKVWFGPDEAVASITLSDEARDESTRFRIHPALLDACIQPCTLLCQRTADGPGAGEVFVPFGLDSFELYGTPGVAVSTNVRLRPPTDGEGGGRVFDVDVFDEMDSITASLRGLQLRRMRLAARGANDGGRLYSEKWVDAHLSESALALKGTRWLFCADTAGLAEMVALKLEAVGATCLRIAPTINPGRLKLDIARELSGNNRLDGIVHFGSLDSASPLDLIDEPALRSAVRRATGTALTLIQSIGRSRQPATPLWIVTRGARSVHIGEPVNVLQAGALGLARTTTLEYPEFTCRCVDLDPVATTDDSTQLAEEFAHPTNQEVESAWRAGGRLAPRLSLVVSESRVSSAGPAWRLEIAQAGSLDGLAIRPAAHRAPKTGEVEIEVSTAGLNFRDVLNALGMYPGGAGPLGGECAGVVRRVGAGVTGITEGDEVMAFTRGAFASHVIVAAPNATRRPRTLTMAEAGSTPVAFLTAVYALERLARIRAGERILIHAAAGGVGLAAVQIALLNGAEVFATAGSPAKRDFLRSLGIRHVMDSRSLAFVDEIRNRTKGTGMDVVLNALTGDFISASVGALAKGGRFVEMGKREIWSAERMSRERPDVRYFPFDLGDAAEADATLIPELFAEITARFDTGTLRPLPVAGFDMAFAKDAFRMMAQARHTGKIVLSVARPRPATPDRGGTYLVTGGLGAIGIRVARWLADRGAKHLVLASRHAPAAPVAEVIHDLRNSGVRVTVAQLDVADGDALTTLIEEIEGTDAPLRGIVHSAGVLDDGIVMDLDWERIERLMDPKIIAAWQLHRLTRTLNLDFFVTFSAGAAVLGSPGQAGYCAANLMLDALATARRSMGLPATSIAWGPWADAGMAAELSERDAARWLTRGVSALSTNDALTLMATAIERYDGAVAAVDVDWSRFSAIGSSPPRFSELATKPVAITPRSDSAMHAREGLAARLSAVPLANRRSELMAFVREQARASLGLDASVPIDDRRPFKELGLDSLMAVELRNILLRSTGRPLPATLLFDYPTLETLIKYLSRVLELETASTVPKPTSVAPDVVALSDDEAEAQLLAELERGTPGDRP